MSLILQIQIVGGFAICLFALWKGSPPEKFGAGLVAVVGVILPTLFNAFVPDTAKPIISLTSDGLTAIGLMIVALAYGSLWIGGAMLLYAAQFTLHSYYFVTERAVDRFHAVVNNLDFLGIHLCLVIGTLVAWRERVVSARRAAAMAAPPPA